MKRIVLIDGEVNKRMLRYPERLVKTIRLTEDKGETCNDLNTRHATVIAGILEQLASGYQIVNIAVLGRDYSARIADLIAALHMCIELNADIVSISMGSALPTDALRLYPITKEIVDHGTIIVAAQSNSGEWTFPAAFRHVLGVQCDLLERLPPRGIDVHESNLLGIDITASCLGLLLDREDNRNSFAVPVVVAKLLTFPQLTVQQFMLWLKCHQKPSVCMTVNESAASTAGKPCLIGLCLPECSFHLADAILRCLNQTHNVQTVGVVAEDIFDAPCWMKVGSINELTYALLLLEKHSVADIILVVASASANEFAEIAQVDLVVNAMVSNTWQWSVDGCVDQAQCSGAMSAEEAAYMIRRTLETGKIYFGEGGK